MAARLRHKTTDDHARNYSQIAYEYAQAAVKDKKGKTHCKWVRLAAKRHLDDLKKKAWPYYFDEWHGNDICDFIEKLPHIEGKWKTPDITLEPVQIFILVVVFGWRWKSNDNRRFTTSYIEMARKGGKSTLTAGLALYCLTCEDEVGPQIIIGASTGDQALKVFKPAYKMAKQSTDLREAFGLEVYGSDKEPRAITCADNGGFMQPINSKSSTQDGWNPHVGILDELHAHKDRGLYDVINSAFGARDNPLMWMITTAGYVLDGVCYEQRTLVTKILDGIVDADHYFGIIFTYDEDDQGKELDESLWIKSNPMLGIAPKIERLRAKAVEAKNSPASMGEFKTKHLNIWTAAKGAWLNYEQWKKCGGPVDLEQLVRVPAYGGLDLSATTDITAFVLAWEVGGRLKVWPRFYLPEDTVWPRTEKGSVPYQTWADMGILITTPGNVCDYSFIKRDIKDALDRFNIQQIGFDPWNATQTVVDLMEEGAPMVEMRQGTKTFHPAMKELERRITAQTLDHGDNPVLNWMASNIVARKDANENMAPDKRNSQEKIDGIVAMLEAMGLMLLQETNQSVYETHGIRTL